MKYILNETENNEPTVSLRFHKCDNGVDVNLVGSTANNGEWLIASFTSDGRFQPNKAGANQCGLMADDVYFQL